MEITLSHRVLSERGKRDNNEDFVWARPDLQLYLVCDGVGGSARGEVASRRSVEAIVQYFETHPLDYQQITPYIQSAVAAAEQALQQHVQQHPQSRGLGTTLTLLHFHAAGATIAHIGDSRVYHYRRNEDLFVTEDHSLVMDLLKAGWITPNEVRNHPRRNVITRAIQANPDKSVKAAVQVITDIQAGDRFLLCSDGVTEAFTDEELNALFEQFIDNQSFIEQIQAKCLETSHDNYTCLVLRVNAVKGHLPGISHFKSNIEVTSSNVSSAAGLDGPLSLPNAASPIMDLRTSVQQEHLSQPPVLKSSKTAVTSMTHFLMKGTNVALILSIILLLFCWILQLKSHK